MKKLLFINGCVRGTEKSRTYLLCEKFLNTYRRTHPGIEIEQLNLAQMPLTWLNAEDLDKRDSLIAKGQLDGPDFQLARQFADADRILVGAPFWDLSVPAVVKVYFELVSVCNITFAYTEYGQEGRCNAGKMLLITTAGGPMGEEDCACGYLKALCNMYGIGSFEAITAEGLDIWGAPVQELLDEAAGQATVLAASW